MNELWKLVKGFMLDEEGATATEYAVMLALIILIALGAIIFLGQRVQSGFSTVASAISSAGS
jgi:pilus assembly protein Flp/PilA